MSSFGSNRKFEKLYGECPLLVFCCLSGQVETFDQMCQMRYELLQINYPETLSTAKPKLSSFSIKLVILRKLHWLLTIISSPDGKPIVQSSLEW